MVESGTEDQVICLHFPYESIWEAVPANELRKIQECDELIKKKDGIINLLANKYGVESNLLYKY